MEAFYGRLGTLVFAVLCLSACGSRQNMAPVEEIHWKRGSYHPLSHTVTRGETLYAIAFKHDLDYRQLAEWNALPSPYVVRVGQVIRLTTSRYRTQSPIPQVSSSQPSVFLPNPNSKTVWATHKTPAPPRPLPARGNIISSPQQIIAPTANGWRWPAKGRIASTFSPESARKGINIEGKKGDKIYAAAKGVVAYAGSGLAGYGNLIIIKHESQYLTAYGNNAKNLVHEGQQIQAGQVIADMGIVDRRFWGVHFEIRKSGKPVNPLSYLQKGR